ncbi:MAG: hypothetical protein AAGF26_11855 [Cyanobacteria bacterium P01_G01_bin.49]
MTLTFNQGNYKQLLVKYSPKLIRTEEENEQALRIIEELMHHPQRTPEEDELYDLLSFLVEKFETEFYQPGKDATPISVLCFLMEQNNLSRTDIEALFQEELNWEGLINQTVVITPEQAKILGNFFGVDSSLFTDSNNS